MNCDCEKHIGCILRFIRVSKGISQEYITEATGINVYRIEQGINSPRIHTLFSVLDIVEVSASDFFRLCELCNSNPSYGSDYIQHLIDHKL